MLPHALRLFQSHCALRPNNRSYWSSAAKNVNRREQTYSWSYWIFIILWNYLHIHIEYSQSYQIFIHLSNLYNLIESSYIFNWIFIILFNKWILSRWVLLCLSYLCRVLTNCPKFNKCLSLFKLLITAKYWWIWTGSEDLQFYMYVR